MENSGSEQRMTELMIQFFQEEQWNFQRLDTPHAIRAGYRGELGTWVCYARVDPDAHRFIFRAMTGLNIPMPYRAQVIEYLIRVNHYLDLGCFDMDFNRGDVSFRAGVETPMGELSVDMVRAIAYYCVHTMDHYFPGIMAVIHGGLSPEAALARVEAQPVES